MATVGVKGLNISLRICMQRLITVDVSGVNLWRANNAE